MQRRKRAVGGAKQRHAVVLEWLFPEVADGCHAAHLDEVAEKPAEKIDAVYALLGELPAGSACRIGPPLRLIARPATDSVAATGRDGASEIALLESSSRLKDGRVVAVIESALQKALRPARCNQHCIGFRQRPAERLLAQDMFAGFEGGNRYFRVNMRRCADHDGVDVLAFDSLPPIRPPSTAQLL